MYIRNTYLLLKPHKSQVIFCLTNICLRRCLSPGSPKLAPVSQGPATWSIHQSRGLPRGRRRTGCPIHTCLNIWSTSLHWTCPTHFSLLLFTIAPMSGSLYSSRNSRFFIFHTPYLKFYFQKSSVSSNFFGKCPFFLTHTIGLDV